MFDPAVCYDAAVIGGGLCGFAAARALARSGARVLLVERRPVLGWELTWAFHTELGRPTCEAALWLQRAMAAANACRDGILDPPVTEIVLDQEATDSGCDVLLYAQPVAVAQADGRLTSVLLGTKSGEIPVRARAFLDATDNALIWRLAGDEAKGSDGPSAELCVLLNGAPGLPAGAPLAVGALGKADNVTVSPTLWPGEVAVRLRVGSHDIRQARLALPSVLRELREGWGFMQDAVVTSVGASLYPVGGARLDDFVGRGAAKAGNLFAGGSWAHQYTDIVGDRSAGLTASQRLAVGERAAGAVAAALGSLPEPPTDAPLPHSRVTPPAHEADVVVCGGGTGGAIAAIAAARRGASTLLIEQGTCLGGIGTGGGIHSYYHGVAGGLQDDVDARVAELAPLFGPAAGFHPEAKKVALEQLAAEAGVTILYNTIVTGAQAEPVPDQLPVGHASPEPPRRLTAVIVAGPDGNATVHGKAFVDGTGDGDLAAMAGAEFTFGRDADGLPHAYSLPAGRLSDDGKLLITNFDAGYCDPTDVVDMTRARRHALGHYRKPRYEAASRLVYIAPILGLRNSRQVVGDVRVTMADEIAGRQFPDVIAYAFSHFDNHGFDYENESDQAMLWVWLLGNWSRRIGCEIPYRALLPRGIEGLVMGCRALSLTHDAHNQLRMQRDLQRVGEAAGVAAAMAARRGVTPRALPVEDLQAALLEAGALGPREQTRLPGPAPDAGVHESSWMPPQPPALPAAQWAEALGGEKSQEAAWELVRRGDEALPLLLEAAGAEQPARRFWASVTLAMLRRPEAAPELRAAVAERREDVPEGRKTAPLWHGAIVLLGRIGDREAVPELCAVLEDREAPLDALIAAARALGRIGDPAAATALEAAVERSDLPASRVLQNSGARAINDVVEDARWQIDLAVAEALARLGVARPDLAGRHLADERALVRRCAERVLELCREAEEAG